MEKLKTLRKEKGLKQQDLAEMLNVTDGTVSNWEKGSSQPDNNALTKLSEIFDVSIDYLLDKSEYRNNDEVYVAYAKKNEAPIEEWIRQGIKGDELDKRIKEYNDALEEEEKERYGGMVPKSVKQKNNIRRKMPHLFLAYSAGFGNFLDGGSDYEYCVFDNVPFNADFAVTIQGDSMIPKFFDGDIVFVKCGAIVEPWDVGVFVLNGDGYLKQLQNRQLVSLNSHYKPIKIEESDVFYTCGKVVGKANVLNSKSIFKKSNP